MKSFALHLVVVFIIGAQYHHNNIGIFCSSSSSSTTRPQAAAADVAHDHMNSSRIPPSSLVLTSVRSARNINSNGNSSSYNGDAITSNALHHHNQLQRKQQTTKTTRTIQRLVGGHLQHPTENKRLPHQNHSTTTQLSRVFFRRKPSSTATNHQLRNTYHSNQSSNSRPLFQRNKEVSEFNDVEDLNSDAALLEDPQELDNWDNGILRSSAGAGKENIIKSKKKDDSKKTLADQVRDGKYGLIEKELFQEPPVRPGIISYLSNKEVPNDNKRTLGGLNEEDIWLAEDHLLVLKGGSLTESNEDEPWEPIDDYQAPSRQIKIPPNPKVPPPFPVQFEDNGPIQFIGNHKFSFFNPLINESLPFIGGNGYLPSSESNSDNEKNSVTRTRTSKNSTESKSGGYFYPSPYPSWLNNNQTFTNPFLNTPVLPPVGKGSNSQPIGGSLDNSTDYIDEDDPSLYYPPPYSFVYESNYSSPVAPGPLVPGIVLPPPPNSFARLEVKKPPRPTQSEVPFRQILTKISEYKPKTVTITTLPPPTTTTAPPTRPTTTTTTVLYTTPRTKDIVFTVTKPVKKPERIRVHTPSKQYVPAPQYVPTTPPPPPPPQTSPPEIISFVPKGSVTGGTSSAKGNPIYYEYFDARKVPNNQNYYKTQEYVPSSPPTPQPVFLQPLHQPQPRPYNNVQITTIRPVQQPRLSKSYLPTRPFTYDDYIYITPKPEIRPNGISDNFVPYITKTTFKPVNDFEREVDAIRQTLQYYKSQQLQQNTIPRTPRPKAVYEYSFDATKPSRNFHPPLQTDDEPFKPMVKYSPPLDDENGFKAIAYAKSDEGSQYEQDYYTRTSTLSPVQQNNAKTYNIQPIVYETTPIPEAEVDNTQQSIQNSGSGWISIEKQVVQEIAPQTARLSAAPKHRGSAGYSRNVDHPRHHTSKQYSGYQYNPPPTRQNNRYYQIEPDDSFTKHINSIKSQLRPYKLRQPISLENDTYINYLPERPPINPDAEFIHPQSYQQNFYQQQPPLPPFVPVVVNPHIQRLPNREIAPPPVSLHRDILVNYRQPLPPINVDSEYIQPQSQIINSRSPSQYRLPSNIQQPPAQSQLQQQQQHQHPQHRLPSEQSGLYYLPSRNFKYVRSNNNDN